jgi:hypothetical protein
VAGNEVGDLADVHLDEATSDDELDHGREDSAQPAISGTGS